MRRMHNVSVDMSRTSYACDTPRPAAPPGPASGADLR